MRTTDRGWRIIRVDVIPHEESDNGNWPDPHRSQPPDLLAEAVEVLEEAEAYFDNRVDAEPFYDPAAPEMQMLTTIRATLTRIKESRNG